MSLSDAKLEVVAGHYTDTFDLTRATVKKRDRLFAGVLVILFVMLFQMYAPSESATFISDLIAEKLGARDGINFIYVQSTIWFVLLASAVKYFQTVVSCERRFNYIHSLESILSAEYDGQTFTREGFSYLKDYPAFLRWASFLYTVLFPAILVLVASAKIILEFKAFGFSELLVWFNGLMFLFLIVSVALYLNVLHSKSKED